MGLDMMAYAKKVDLAEDVQTDFQVEYEWEEDELCYWRKHPNLHGWMFNLYLDKGGKYDFNGNSLRLNREDIDRLEQAIVNDELPHTQGFFFGQSPVKGDEYYEDRKQYDLNAIKKMREALDDGFLVWYDSSW